MESGASDGWAPTVGAPVEMEFEVKKDILAVLTFLTALVLTLLTA